MIRWAQIAAIHRGRDLAHLTDPAASLSVVTTLAASAGVWISPSPIRVWVICPDPMSAVETRRESAESSDV